MWKKVNNIQFGKEEAIPVATIHNERKENGQYYDQEGKIIRRCKMHSCKSSAGKQKGPYQVIKRFTLLFYKGPCYRGIFFENNFNVSRVVKVDCSMLVRVTIVKKVYARVHIP
ncbi:hypothetical protein WAK64_03475 [Bacillus spongiae]|uniref:Uncharacterized protein n=1 Tax=Bacillus spongiae TaxID=2683610 RepID=A0ABU8HAF8_9BACI